jgi:hypothetical protein
MESVLLFPEHPELRLYRQEPQQVKADFLAHTHVPWLLRTLPLHQKWSMVNWNWKIDIKKVVVGEPTLQVAKEPMSLQDTLRHWSDTWQRVAEEDKHLTKEQLDYHTRVMLNSLWTAHQDYYSFTLGSRVNPHLFTVTTPTYTQSGSPGYFFSK